MQDFQEAWTALFDSVDTVNDCTRIATGVLSTLKIDPVRMKAGLSADMLATDLAEYLVRKGESASPLIYLQGNFQKSYAVKDRACSSQGQKLFEGNYLCLHSNFLLWVIIRICLKCMQLNDNGQALMATTQRCTRV